MTGPGLTRAAARSDTSAGGGWEPADQRAAKESLGKDFSGGLEPDRSGECAEERDSAAGGILKDGPAGAWALPCLPGNS